MSESKDLGTLHLCRRSYLTIKTPDHKDTYTVVLDKTGALYFLRNADENQKGWVCSAQYANVETDDGS